MADDGATGAFPPRWAAAPDGRAKNTPPSVADPSANAARDEITPRLCELRRDAQEGRRAGVTVVEDDSVCGPVKQALPRDWPQIS
jgi:hypothetical protein